MSSTTLDTAFAPKGSTNDLEASETNDNGDTLRFAAHHTFDGLRQLRRINLSPDAVHTGLTPPLIFCKRLTRLFAVPAQATFKEVTTSKDGRQHLYSVTVVEKNARRNTGKSVLAEGWLRIVKDDRQKRRNTAA